MLLFYILLLTSHPRKWFPCLPGCSSGLILRASWSCDLPGQPSSTGKRQSSGCGQSPGGRLLGSRDCTDTEYCTGNPSTESADSHPELWKADYQTLPKCTDQEYISFAEECSTPTCPVGICKKILAWAGYLVTSATKNRAWHCLPY